jgi:hypothetical protein
MRLCGTEGFPPYLDFVPLQLFPPVLLIMDVVSQQLTALFISFVRLFCSLPQDRSVSLFQNNLSKECDRVLTSSLRHVYPSLYFSFSNAFRRHFLHNMLQIQLAFIFYFM